ncbi:eyes absent homolog isoform X2 [Vitis riparia]|uniref:eyes absent homolog isoform X2 n=1 Tax=Vitis riparia TaxID=96939 RepID=UPI00155A4EE0|nr:eyes absent homolog isoform X2 [Vitis riparia]
MDELMSGNSTIPNQKMKASAKKTLDPITNVYIWDMDETLILLKSLLNGTYAETFNGLKDVQKGVEIGKMWEKYILQVADDIFFYEQIENYNKPFLDALSQYDDGKDLSDYDFNHDGCSSPYDDLNKRKLAYRHRVIAHKYKQGLHNTFDQDMIKLWDDLYDMTDSYTDRWLSSVYSSWEVGKLQCFSWIKERFSGPNVRFCVIGDGWEECEAAQTMRWPFVKIDLRPGSSHRFPGLTLRTVGHYFSIVYGIPDAENDDE